MKDAKYCVVAVHKGTQIFEKCVPTIKEARKIMKGEAKNKMLKKRPVTDGFIELRRMLPDDDFDSVDNIWAMDIYDL